MAISNLGSADLYNQSELGLSQAPALAVTVYGTSWCLGTQSVRRHLVRLGVRYSYVALDQSPQSFAQLKWLSGGVTNHPTVDVAGEVLVQPTPGELGWMLSRRGLV